MRAQTALFIIAFCAGSLASSTSVRAQEIVPVTPPELRDFRLDTPRVQPQPETQPPPKSDPVIAAPPPAVRAQSETRPSVPTRRAQPDVEATQRDAGPVKRTPAESTTIEPGATPQAVLPSPETQPESPAPTVVTKAKGDGPALPYWQIAAALAALSLLTAIVIWFRRRRATAPEYVPELLNVKPETVKATQPVLAPLAAVKIVAEANPKSAITIQFVPQKATITFATLTIKGILRVINEGAVDAQNMQLRAGLISASHQQQEATSQFFGTAHNITPNPMGHAKAGETIGMDLELSVPLSEMHSFTLGEQRMLVPILLASIEYHGGNQTVSHYVEIAFMIGRESTPPRVKMGPLRLDLGPRSYVQLGTRPLYA